MFKRLADAYDTLVSSIHEYAASWRDSAKRVRELHSLDAPAALPALPESVTIIPPAAPPADAPSAETPPETGSRRRPKAA